MILQELGCTYVYMYIQLSLAVHVYVYMYIQLSFYLYVLCKNQCNVYLHCFNLCIYVCVCIVCVYLQGGRSHEITPVTSAQIQFATEVGDKFRIDDRELSQVIIM